jgi:hypothetical protein
MIKQRTILKIIHVIYTVGDYACEISPCFGCIFMYLIDLEYISIMYGNYHTSANRIRLSYGENMTVI